MSRTLHAFLGTARWKELLTVLDEEGRREFSPPVPFAAALAALLLCVTPVALTVVDSLRETTTRIPTVGFGVCAILALLLRRRMAASLPKSVGMTRSLRLTHTAVALGCIPAVIILLASPTLLADRHDTLTTAVRPGGHPGAPMAKMHLAFLLVSIAGWVAVTEEVLFRGFLVSVLRRLPYRGSGRIRDLVAASVSALLFGVAHYVTWGLMPSIALTGLGFGFALAYIANGERLMPVVLYHFIFDLLSILVSVGYR